MSEDLVLIHHGIKGMKWGVRRFQNRDGSLTARGRARLKESVVKLHSKLTSKKTSDEKDEKVEQSSSGTTSTSTSTNANDASSNTNTSNTQETTLQESPKQLETQPSLNDAISAYLDTGMPYDYSMETLNQRNKVTEDRLKLGVAVASTALAAYGAYKLITSNKSSSGDTIEDAAKKVVDDVIEPDVIETPKGYSKTERVMSSIFSKIFNRKNKEVSVDDFEVVYDVYDDDDWTTPIALLKAAA